MNAYEQLEAIHDRLEENGANEKSVELVEKFLKRAESERCALNASRYLSVGNRPVLAVLAELKRVRLVELFDRLEEQLVQCAWLRSRPAAYDHVILSRCGCQVFGLYLRTSLTGLPRIVAPR